MSKRTDNNGPNSRETRYRKLAWLPSVQGSMRNGRPPRPRTITVVAPLPRLNSRTRLRKFAAVYNTEFSVCFLGWERTAADGDLPLGAEAVSKITHRGGGYSVSGNYVHYLKWMVKSSVALVRDRPSFVHALGLESALAAAPLKVLRPRTRIIYDDADRFSLCRGGRLRSSLQRIERLVSRAAYVHLIPSLARYEDGIPCRNVVLIANTPDEASMVKMAAIETEIDQSIFNVLMTGWIGETRGASLAEYLAESFALDPGVQFWAIGRLTGAAAHRFIKLDNVTYLGEVSAAEALAMARDSSLVLTLYDPRIEINRYAESNKWGDCRAVGTPFLVNSEVRTAEAYCSSGAAVSFPYDQFDQAEAIIRELRIDSGRLDMLTDRMAELYSAIRPFDEVVRSELLTLLVNEESTDVATAKD